MFTRRLSLDAEDRALDRAMVREGAVAFALKKIEETGLSLPGVVFCKAILQAEIAIMAQQRTILIYKKLSRAGIDSHTLTSISTDYEDDDRVVLVLHTEGEA